MIAMAETTIVLFIVVASLVAAATFVAVAIFHGPPAVVSNARKQAWTSDARL
jgi:hypothetical protein